MPTADIRRHVMTDRAAHVRNSIEKIIRIGVAETLAAKNKTMFVILDDTDFLILSEYPASRGDWIQPP